MDDKKTEIKYDGLITDMLSELRGKEGKMVIFNVGKEKIVGEFVSLNERYLTCVVLIDKNGHKMRTTIRLNKVSSFSVEV